MLRMVRRLLLLALGAVFAAAVVLVLTSRPTLSEAHSDAAKAWTALHAPLLARYDAVAALERAMHAAGPDRDFLTSARDALAEWNALTVSSDLSRQISAANRVEGAARRLSVAASDPSSRYSTNGQVVAASGVLLRAQPAKSAIDHADKAILHYNDVRNGALRSIVAGALGYDALPRFVAT
jgi:hypothetical protein